jgi:hypothetical protein
MRSALDKLVRLLQDGFFWLWLGAMAAMAAVAWKDRAVRWALLLGAAVTIGVYLVVL